MLIPKERLAVLAAVFVVAAGAAWYLRDWLKPISMEPVPLKPSAASPVDKPASPRPVSLRDGSTRDLSKPPGKLLVVHFWATWCPPCVEELPGLYEFARSVKNDPAIEVLAVSVDTDWKTVDGFLGKRGVPDLEVALDPQRTTAKAFGTEKFPETWFLGPDGKVLEGFIGPADWKRAETRKRIAELRALAAAGSRAEARKPS